MNQIIRANIEAMLDETGFSIIIVVVSTEEQQYFWSQRLQETCLCKRLLVVHEDWPGGAGNGLGTLYALRQALELAPELLGLMRQGASVAVYHTAGKGTRLAPLPASEWNNKSAVKLPRVIRYKGEETLLTLLEAVIQQTSVYAASRPGRVSVFWGDQLFIPSVSAAYTPTHHVDLLMQGCGLPSEQEWEKRGLDRYGVLAINRQGEAQQFEKLRFAQFQSLVPVQDVSVGISLGSFSLSTQATEALLDEFSEELTEKKIHLNSDPHFWMASTLPLDVYLQAVRQEDCALDLESLHQRMSQVKERLLQDSMLGYLGGVDVGSSAYWWDYGRLSSYYENHLMLLEKSDEADAMRLFFDVDLSKPLIACEIRDCQAENSLLIGVQADTVRLRNCVVLNSTAPSISGDGCLIYNVVDKQAVDLGSDGVRADLFLPSSGEHLKIYTDRHRDSGGDWKIRLPKNRFSYADLYDANCRVSLQESAAFAHQIRDSVLANLREQASQD